MTGISEDKFGQVWPAHVVNLIAFLVRLRTAFDGDLENALIMAVLGSAMLPRGTIPDDMSYADYQRVLDCDSFYKPLNTFSITEITGIPRETVRRKLAHMEERDMIQKDCDGHWHVQLKGARELEPVTQYSLEYLNRMSVIILAASTTPDATVNELAR
jgi:hypothetical protein